MQKIKFELVLGVFLTFSCLSFAAPKLHILYAIDPHSGKVGADLSNACATNREALVSILNEVFVGDRADRLVQRKVHPDRFSGKAILDFYTDELKPAAEDTIVFYYCGHGTMTNDNQHMLAMSGGYLERGALRNVMARSKAHLAIIITDTCSSYAGQVGTVPPRRVPADWEAFKNLFFDASGLVDISAARAGEFAWFTGLQGGIFSQSLFRLFCEPKSELDQDENGFVSWKEVYNKTYYDTQSAFEKLKENASDGAEIKQSISQSPAAFWLAQSPDWTRKIKVKNERNEVLCIWLKALVPIASGGWTWTEVNYWEIQPGQEAHLSFNGTAFKANEITWWANSAVNGSNIVWGTKANPRNWRIYPFRESDEADPSYVLKFTY